MNETKAKIGLAHCQAEDGLTLSAKSVTSPFESPGFESLWACFEAKVEIFFHMIQDSAANPGTWFGDINSNEKEKWQGLELSSALFAI